MSFPQRVLRDFWLITAVTAFIAAVFIAMLISVGYGN